MKPLKLLCLVLPLTLIAAGFKSQPEKANELNKSLLQAAAKGNIKQVKLLLSKGADVNAKDRYGLTPLHCAVVKGQKNIVEFLLTKGARMIQGITPSVHHSTMQLGRVGFMES